MIRAMILTILIYGWVDAVSADECIEPISDRDLLKKYKPCYGGWCLRK